MEIGIIGFGSRERDPGTGRPVTEARAMRALVEAAELADQVGVDFFGVGEHHRRDSPASAPVVVLAAAAARTERIKLGSAITVLGADDPIRVVEQFSTLDGVSRGRAELMVGRGAFREPFALFDVDPASYDALFAEKLDLLMTAVRNETVSWSGSYRSALHDAVVVPRPEQTTLPVWLATGGQPHSIVRAARYGVSVMFSAIGTPAEAFAPHAALYRTASDEAGTPLPQRRVGVGAVGFVADSSDAAREQYRQRLAERVGDLGDDDRYERRIADGFFLVGSPEEVAARIVHAHEAVGIDRILLQADIGDLPYEYLMRHIELVGTRVKPLVDAALATSAASEALAR